MPSSRAIAARPRAARGRRAARRRRRSARACRAPATSRAARRARRRPAAAARVSRSAASRLRSRSAVDVQLDGGGAHEVLLSPWIDPSVNPLRRAYRARMRPHGAWRGGGREPAGRTLPLPPARMPLLRGGRPLKRWRWVGAFGPERDAVRRARARSARVPVAWWAVWDGERAARAHAPARRPGARWRAGARARAPACSSSRSRRARASRSSRRTGAQYIWTRKQGGMPRRAARVLGGGAFERPRLRRRLRRLPRAPHRLALVGGRRRRRVGRAGGVEPGRRRARRRARPRSARCGSTASRTRSSRCAFAHDLSGGRRSALRRRGRARARARTCCSCAPTTSSRSARSAARCPTPGRCAGWGVMERHEVRW